MEGNSVEKRTRPGGRTARVRAAVLAATIDELSEKGYDGFSVASVADRAGVHRSTVHRKWPDRGPLVAEALLEEVGKMIPFPDSGDFRGDLRALLELVAATLSAPESSRLIRALLIGRQSSPEVADVADRVWRERLAMGESVFRRGIQRGELRDDIAPSDMVRMALGPLYLRFVATGEPLDAKTIETTIELVLTGIASGTVPASE